MGSKREVIYLGDYIHKDGLVYVFRHEGKWARKELHLDVLDKDNKLYEIVFHPNTRLVTSEFLMGLLARSYRELGFIKFHLKYKFSGLFYEKNKKVLKKHLKTIRKKAKILPTVGIY